MSSRAIERERQNLIDKYNAQAGRMTGVTSEQQEALQGTSGTPNDANRYVTELDAANLVTGPASAVDNNLAQFNGITGKIVEDSGLSNTDVTSAVSLKHAIQHAIIATADHTSTATSGKMLKANANGLPVDATNTDAEVASAVTLKHTAGTDTALGAVGSKNPPIDADKAIYRDSTASDALVTSTWTQVKAFLKTYFDTLYVAVTGRYRYAAALADAGTITLPTITANWPAHGFIHCAHASTGVISESAEFEYGSTGAVQIIRGTANIEANGATAGKISLGPAVAANPVVIKNNLGGGVSVNAMITLWYG